MSGGDLPRGVAILGRAGSGKTTLADALVDAGILERRVSFAAELKADLATLGVHKGQPFAREMMVAYGQHKRAGSPDYWVERLRNKLHDDLDGCVVDDARFPNEVAFLRDRGFLIVKLQADGVTRMARGIPREFAYTNDTSETACDDVIPDLWLNSATMVPEACVRRVSEALSVAA